MEYTTPGEDTYGLYCQTSRGWMEIATANHEFPEPSASWSEVSKNNIALTCAGIALETAYKAILLADGRSRYKWEAQPYHQDMPYTHAVRELHSRLRDDRKAIVDSVIESLYGGGGSALEWYFKTVDVYVNHPYRKYWFIGASMVGGFSRGTFQMIQTVHHALMDQAGSAWSELQSEYSATAREIREVADRTPAVYDLEESFSQDRIDLVAGKSRAAPVRELGWSDASLGPRANLLSRWPDSV